MTFPCLPLQSYPVQSTTCPTSPDTPLLACPTATRTIPTRPRRSPPTCIRHSVPANPHLVFPFVHSPHLSHPRLPVRAFPILSSSHLPLRAFCPINQSQIIRNLVQQIVLNQVFPLQFQLASQP